MTAQPQSLAATVPARVRRNRRVFVRDLVTQARIGVWDHERERSQPVRISLEVLVDARHPHEDRLESVVCYQQLVDGIHAILAAGHVDLVETLAEEIGAMALVHTAVLSATVTVEKLEAIAGAGSAGVTLALEREPA